MISWPFSANLWNVNSFDLQKVGKLFPTNGKEIWRNFVLHHSNNLTEHKNSIDFICNRINESINFYLAILPYQWVDILRQFLSSFIIILMKIHRKTSSLVCSIPNFFFSEGPLILWNAIQNDRGTIWAMRTEDPYHIFTFSICQMEKALKKTLNKNGKKYLDSNVMRNRSLVACFFFLHSIYSDVFSIEKMIWVIEATALRTSMSIQIIRNSSIQIRMQNVKKWSQTLK